MIRRKDKYYALERGKYLTDCVASQATAAERHAPQERECHVPKGQVWLGKKKNVALWGVEGLLRASEGVRVKIPIRELRGLQGKRRQALWKGW
jgi:hypothetical protein